MLKKIDKAIVQWCDAERIPCGKCNSKEFCYASEDIASGITCLEVCLSLVSYYLRCLPPITHPIWQLAWEEQKKTIARCPACRKVVSWAECPTSWDAPDGGNFTKCPLCGEWVPDDMCEVME